MTTPLSNVVTFAGALPFDPTPMELYLDALRQTEVNERSMMLIEARLKAMRAEAKTLIANWKKCQQKRDLHAVDAERHSTCLTPNYYDEAEMMKRRELT